MASGNPPATTPSLRHSRSRSGGTQRQLPPDRVQRTHRSGFRNGSIRWSSWSINILWPCLSISVCSPGGELLGSR